MRLLLAALAAGLLAGCAAPEPAPPSSTAAPGGEPALPACPLSEERHETVAVASVVVTIEGCLAASEPAYLGALPAGIEPDFEVRPGARDLVAQLHLHGSEPLRVALVGPSGEIRARGAAHGDAEHDSFVRFELERPEAGTWRLEADVGKVAFARAWTAVATIGY